jgi:hypothetical protein
MKSAIGIGVALARYHTSFEAFDTEVAIARDATTVSRTVPRSSQGVN